MLLSLEIILDRLLLPAAFGGEEHQFQHCEPALHIQWLGLPPVVLSPEKPPGGGPACPWSRILPFNGRGKAIVFELNKNSLDYRGKNLAEHVDPSLFDLRLSLLALSRRDNNCAFVVGSSVLHCAKLVGFAVRTSAGKRNERIPFQPHAMELSAPLERMESAALSFHLRIVPAPRGGGRATRGTSSPVPEGGSPLSVEGGGTPVLASDTVGSPPRAPSENTFDSHRKHIRQHGLRSSPAGRGKNSPAAFVQSAGGVKSASGALLASIEPDSIGDANRSGGGLRADHRHSKDEQLVPVVERKKDGAVVGEEPVVLEGGMQLGFVAELPEGGRAERSTPRAAVARLLSGGDVFIPGAMEWGAEVARGDDADWVTGGMELDP